MNKRILALHDWGCDTESAMNRMLDDEAFYLECLQDIPEDPNFDLLLEALKKSDCAAAFDAAHTLKGVLANLGLTPMYQKVVEPLRAGKAENLAALLDKCAALMEMKQRLSQILQN